MIVRALPDFDINCFDKVKRNQLHLDEKQLLFFNSGSSALLFFLRIFGPGKRVGIQAYTCSSVKDTILRAGDVPIYMDIDCMYFTTSRDHVSEILDKIDILVITHLFGIPNPYYHSIKEDCKQNNIEVIDDLCQTVRAKINNEYIEDISDNYFYSFFYDKPISSFCGGALYVNERLASSAKVRFETLPKESRRSGIRHLRQAFWIARLLSPENYKYEFRRGSKWEFEILSSMPEWVPINIVKFLLCPIINSIMLRLGRHHNETEIIRMSDVQSQYVLYQLAHFNPEPALLLKNKNKFGEEAFPFLQCTAIQCSSTKRTILNKKFVKDNTDVEIDLYNWKTLITDETAKFPNSMHIIENYVNYPLL